MKISDFCFHMFTHCIKIVFNRLADIIGLCWSWQFVQRRPFGYAKTELWNGNNLSLTFNRATLMSLYTDFFLSNINSTHLLANSTRTNAQTIHIRHTGFLHSHLPYIINHHELLSCFMKLYNRMTAQILAFL